MANEPTEVILVDGNGRQFLQVYQSHQASMNDQGSENTRSVIIRGPVNCVVTCFDDDQWKVDENSVVIIKKIATYVSVPIATDFVSGEWPEGIYRGNGPGYTWQLNKAVKTTFLDDVWSAIEWIGNHVSIGSGDPGDPGPSDPSDPSSLTQGCLTIRR